MTFLNSLLVGRSLDCITAILSSNPAVLGAVDAAITSKYLLSSSHSEVPKGFIFIIDRVVLSFFKLPPPPSPAQLP